MTNNNLHPNPYEIIRDQLRHDLNFRVASFKPNISKKLKSLWDNREGIEDVNWEELPEHWSKLKFDEIIGEVKKHVRKKLIKQIGKDDNYIKAFLEIFEYVEYIVNARLIYTLCSFNTSELYNFMTDLFNEKLLGNYLKFQKADDLKNSFIKRKWFHTAQDDGRLINDELTISIEIKTNAKTKGTTLKCEQLAKHSWLLNNNANIKCKRILAIVPEKNGELFCLDNSVLNDRGFLRCSKVTTKFRNFCDDTGFKVEEMEEQISSIRPIVRTFKNLLDCASKKDRNGNPLYSKDIIDSFLKILETSSKK